MLIRLFHFGATMRSSNILASAIKGAPVPIKRNNKWYLDAKTACRLINKDYNTLPTFNQDKTVTFPSNLNVLIKCVGYRKQTLTLDCGYIIDKPV